MTFTASNETDTFHTGQIVKGARCGTFAILGFRVVNGEIRAQLKEVDPKTGKTYRGEIALPLAAIRSI
jgi:hypothetical protein